MNIPLTDTAKDRLQHTCTHKGTRKVSVEYKDGYRITTNTCQYCGKLISVEKLLCMENLIQHKELQI